MGRETLYFAGAAHGGANSSCYAAPNATPFDRSSTKVVVDSLIKGIGAIHSSADGVRPPILTWLYIFSAKFWIVGQKLPEGRLSLEIL